MVADRTLPDGKVRVAGDSTGTHKALSEEMGESLQFVDECLGDFAFSENSSRLHARFAGSIRIRW
jgi:hypothetical protein